MLQDQRQPRSDIRAALRVVLPYAIFASLWILLSDQLVLLLVPDIQTASKISTAKGLLFVLISSLLLLMLLRRERRARWRIEQDRSDLLTREQAARARAESANRAKDEMLAMVSHELRTPLTAILSTAEILQQDATLSQDNRDLLECIRDGVLQESRIVTDLLDGSSLASGKLELNLARIDLHDVVESVLRELKPQLESKQITLRTQLTASCSLLHADRIRLSQAVRNVLGNAVKFTPAHGAIDVSTVSADGRVCLEVRDTGIGIDPGMHSRLFKPFEQGDRSVTRQFGGLGLGLYLTKSIIELHGGTVVAASEGAGKGSAFRVDLPTWSGVETAPAAPLDAPESKGLVTLLVEDNMDTLRVLGRLLSRLGCTVVAARSADEALQAADTQRVDMVISDIGLPDCTGWELMKELRHRHQIPGIAITGFGGEEDRHRSEEAGFEIHLVKPVSFPMLQSAIAEIAARRANTRGETTAP